MSAKIVFTEKPMGDGTSDVKIVLDTTESSPIEKLYATDAIKALARGYARMARDDGEDA